MPGAALGLLLPWLEGALLARLLLGNRANLPTLLGHGLMLGYITVLALLIFYDYIGRPFSYAELISILGLMALSLCLFLARASGSLSVNAALKPETPWGFRVRGCSAKACSAVALLLGLIVLQVAFVASEVMLRPTYAWDAWASWGPETLQHFSSKSFDVVSDTTGNYGLMHKAIHLWMMLAAGTHQAHIAYVPWILCYVAIILAVYGSLASLHSRSAGALGAFLVSSLPLLSTHAALPGYGDIWVALCFTLGALTLSERGSPTRLKSTVLAGIYIIASAVAKTAGLALALPLVTVLLIQWIFFIFPRRASALITGVVALFSVLLVGIAMGWFSIQVPFTAGETTGKMVISRYKLGIEPSFVYTLTTDIQITPLLQAMFQFASWGLLFPVLVLGLFYKGLSQPIALLRDSEAGIFLLGLIVIFFFYTLAAPEFAADHTGINRAMLIVAPLAVHWVVRVAFAPSATTSRLEGNAQGQATESTWRLNQR